MEGIFRKRSHFLLGAFIALFLFAGCASKGDIKRLEDRMGRMEAMIGAGVEASFYPATGFYGPGPTGGNCDAITSTADGDMCMVIKEADSNYGNAMFVYVLDDASSCGGDDTALPPKYFQAADGGNECWELAKVFGLETGAAAYAMSDADGETLENFEVMNGYILATGAGTFNLPDIGTGDDDVPIGSVVCFETQGDVNVSINPDDSDTITLEGVTDTAGHQLDNPSSSQDGTAICITACGSTNWCAPFNPDTWVAGS
jgi:hypothetical protein